MRISGERRHSERRRVLYAGEIIAAGREPEAIECTIRSLSCDGAALRAPADAPRSCATALSGRRRRFGPSATCAG